MANKPISMSKVRNIIKLYSRGIGKKNIAERLSLSKNTVKTYVKKFLKLGRPINELLDMSDQDLNNLFNPPTQPNKPMRLEKLQEFFPLMEKKLRRRGTTVGMLYREFKQNNPDTYGETSFYYYYGLWRKKISPSMHIEHKVGDKVYVDYAGEKLSYVDEDTGEVKQAEVFVAILGWSQYAYVEAMKDQTLEEFIAACENALHYFGGVPLAIVPDNLKSAVFKASNYEPQLNMNFKAFGDHYGTTILPTRSRKPKDKAHVENMVKIAYQRIYTQLDEKKILSLKELNAEMHKHLAVHNDTKLTGKETSRTDQWIVERPSLQSLPQKRYEMRNMKQVTVMKNGHVYLTEDQHYYSVPYQLITKKLQMQYSRSTVNLYLNYEVIASHPRVRSPHNYSTIAEHLSPNHKYLTEWNPDFFIERAKAIDPIVEIYISEVLAKREHPEQAYKSCNGILSFAKRAGEQRLINACKRAHEIGYYNYKIIEEILRQNLDRYEEDTQVVHMPEHENIRGGNYYN